MLCSCECGELKGFTGHTFGYFHAGPINFIPKYEELRDEIQPFCFFNGLGPPFYIQFFKEVLVVCFDGAQ
jgi:hypothetical protein